MPQFFYILKVRPGAQLALYLPSVFYILDFYALCT